MRKQCARHATELDGDSAERFRVDSADSVWAIGGMQAMAAMALGRVPGLEPVDMIVGPGNRFVVEAKRQLCSQVGIDLLAGPTEIGILADDTADPFLVCCDLVGQAEHDPLSRAVPITNIRSAWRGGRAADRRPLESRSHRGGGSAVMGAWRGSGGRDQP